MWTHTNTVWLPWPSLKALSIAAAVTDTSQRPGRTAGEDDVQTENRPCWWPKRMWDWWEWAMHAPDFLYCVNRSDFMWISINHIFCQQRVTFEASTIATSACTDQRSSVSLWTAQRSRNWKIWQMSESGKGKIEQQPLTPRIPKVMTRLTETAEREALLHPLSVCLCLRTHRRNESSMRHTSPNS